MQDFALTFTTEAQAIQALPEYRVTSEDGEQWTGSIIPNATRWIQRPVYDEDGNIITPAETVPGWHCIVRAESISEAAQPFIVADPGDIEPVFAGGWRHPIIPESVTALQGMRAIKHAGLITEFLAWKASLDPVIDFEIIAFLDKAQVWRYDDPIIDAALANWNKAGQKDALFLLAATL